MSRRKGWRGWVSKAANIFAPVAGFALGGPMGAAAGSALARAGTDVLTKGKTTGANILKSGGIGLLGGGAAARAGVAGGQGFGQMFGSARDLGVRGMASNLFTGGGGGSAGSGVANSLGEGAKKVADPGMLSSLGSFAQSNPMAVAGAAQGVSGAMNASAERERTGLERDRFDQENRRYEEEQERRRRVQELLMPLVNDLQNRSYLSGTMG